MNLRENAQLVLDMVADFVHQWLGVTELKSVPKDPKVYANYTPALVDSLLAETAAAVRSLLRHEISDLAGSHVRRTASLNEPRPRQPAPPLRLNSSPRRR